MSTQSHSPEIQSSENTGDAASAEAAVRKRVTVTLVDEHGQAANAFRHGSPARFRYDLQLDGLDGVPMVALEICRADGLLVHGKELFIEQAASGTQNNSSHASTAQVHCEHAVQLDLEPGSYGYGVSLGSVDPGAYVSYRQGSSNRDHLEYFLTWHARAETTGQFDVEPLTEGMRPHYGLTDLVSEHRVEVLAEQPAAGEHDKPSESETATHPTIFHVTHWKAGSQWIKKILRDCVGDDRIVEPQPRMEQFLDLPLQAGKVYPTVYLPSRDFQSVTLPANARHFVVIRDLRDTLVSGYFSMRFSHPVLNDPMARMRARLESLDEEEGLLVVMDKWLSSSAWIQHSWLETGEPLIRYEDLLERDVEILERVLLDACGLPVERDRFRRIVEGTRFERSSGGRARGEEDVTQHMRKGMAGDWRNHFTDRLREAFKIRYGRLLIALGYEADDDW